MERWESKVYLEDPHRYPTNYIRTEDFHAIAARSHAWHTEY